MINLSHIVKVYKSAQGDQVVALDDLSLYIQESSICAILGPSGCGKSTILSIIAGLFPPTRGSVEVHIDRPYDSPVQFGISFQYPALLPWLTVIDNILLPTQIHRSAGISGHDLTDLTDLLGLSAFENKFPHELSGGMQARAALARALILKPPVVLLDEPFGALDEKTTFDLMRLISDINRDINTGFVVVTHSIYQAVYIADRIFTLTPRPGRVIGSYDIAQSRPRDPLVYSDDKLASIVLQIRKDLDIEYV